MQGLRLLIGDSSLTKRQLGWLLMVAGGLLTAGIVLLEVLQVGRGGFGAVQQFAAAGGLLCAAVGLTLLPLGDRPA